MATACLARVQNNPVRNAGVSAQLNSSRIIGLVLTATGCMSFAEGSVAGEAPGESPQITSATSEGESADEEQERRREEDENQRGPLERGVDITTPQVVNEAPLPPQGEPVPTPEIVRGPLYIERNDFPSASIIC